MPPPPRDLPASPPRRCEPRAGLLPARVAGCPGTRRPGTRSIELGACAGVMLGVFVGADALDLPIMVGVDIGAFGILAAWTITGGAILVLALSRQGRDAGGH